MLVTWRYRTRKSIIQFFDPRAWVIFFICFLASVLAFWDLRYLLFFFVLTVGITLAADVSWAEIRRAVLFIGGFILFFAFLTFLTGRGGMELYAEEHILREFRAPFDLFGWVPTLKITAERIMYVVSMMARVFSIAIMTILVPYSLNPALYGVTFRGLGLPDKIAYAMDLTMRFIPTYGRDFTLTMDAQRARGFELDKVKGGLFAQVRKLAPLVVPVTIHAIAGSEDIIDAMDLRAFGVGPRTWLDELKFHWYDWVLIGLGVLMLLFSTALALFGYGKFWVPNFLLPGS